MKNPFGLRTESKNEAYRYFDANIRSLPKNEDGTFNEFASGYHNNDVDAFRHAYVSGVFTQEYNANAADVFGRLNELFPTSSPTVDPAEQNMDLWNNSVGRKYGGKISDRVKLLDELKRALKNGELIIDPGDARNYSGAAMIKDGGEKQVVTLQQNKSGRNITFFDLHTEEIMTDEVFVAAIQQGRYDGYTVKNIHGRPTPVSKRDQDADDNLG